MSKMAALPSASLFIISQMPHNPIACGEARDVPHSRQEVLVPAELIECPTF